MIGIRSAISIRARGHRPHLEAVYMTAPRSVCRNTKKPLPRGGRPYMTRRATSLSRLFGFAEIRPIGQPNSILKRGARAPAQFGKAADVEQFARRAVGPRGVEADLAAVSDGCGHHAREFGDGNVFAGADVDQLIRGVV